MTKNQKLRIGIFISDFGEYLKKNVDFKSLSARLRKLPGVITVQVKGSLADSRGLKFLAKNIREKKLNRVVIATCSPWLYEETWGDALERAGLNRYLLATADLNNYCWTAYRSKKKATSQVENIIKAACRRVENLEAIPRQKTKCSPKVLVIGGGLTGLSVAQKLAASGYPVTLIEESENPGGLVKDLTSFYEDSPFLYKGDRWEPQVIIRDLIKAIKSSSEINFYNRTAVKKVRGQVGNFAADLSSSLKDWSDTFGAIVLATGTKATSPLPSLKLKESTAVTLLSKAYPLIESLFQNLKPASKVAFLMDVESEQGVVTTGAVLSKALKARKAGNEVTIFCRNVRVAALGLEKLYREARSQGVLLVKYQKKPRIKTDDARVTVQVFDEQMKSEIVSDYDLLIVAEQLASDNEGLGKTLRLKRDPENFFQEENVWLYPIRSARRGIFVTGACREPLTVKQIGEEAVAVAAEVNDLLREKTISFDLNTATVDEEKCVFCLTCYRVCPHGAIEMDWEKGVAKVAEIACQACGICASECPAKAIQLRHYTDDQLNSEVGSPPKLLIFACEQSGLKAAEAAGKLGWKIPPATLMVRVPCVGKVDSALILSSLQKGAQKVLILGCYQENCHYLRGSTRATKRVNEIKKRLQEAGLDPERVTIAYLTSKDGAKFRKYVEEMKCEV